MNNFILNTPNSTPYSGPATSRRKAINHSNTQVNLQQKPAAEPHKKLTPDEALLQLSKLGAESNEKNFLLNHVTSSPDFKLNLKVAKSQAKLRQEYDGLEEAYRPIKRSMLGEPYRY